LATQKSRPPPPEGSDAAGLQELCITESEDARVHCAVLNVRPVTPCPPPPATQLPQEHAGTRAKEPCQRSRHRPVPRTGPLPQDPTACLRTDPSPPPRSTPRGVVLAAADKAGRTGQCSTLEHHPGHCAAIRDWMTVLARARLWTTSTRLAASAP
jgi:hypothetical protein